MRCHHLKCKLSFWVFPKDGDEILDGKPRYSARSVVWLHPSPLPSTMDQHVHSQQWLSYTVERPPSLSKQTSRVDNGWAVKVFDCKSQSCWFKSQLHTMGDFPSPQESPYHQESPHLDPKMSRWILESVSTQSRIQGVVTPIHALLTAKTRHLNPVYQGRGGVTSRIPSVQFTICSTFRGAVKLSVMGYLHEGLSWCTITHPVRSPCPYAMNYIHWQNINYVPIYQTMQFILTTHEQWKQYSLLPLSWSLWTYWTLCCGMYRLLQQL